MNNALIYNGALGGLAGGIISERWIVSGAAVDYTQERNRAVTLATAIDALIATTSLGQADSDLMQSICYAVATGRFLADAAPQNAAAIVAYWNEVRGAAAPTESCVVAGTTVTAINAALATGTPQVCFPAGTYTIDAAVNQSTANQVLMFEPGAVLLFSANGLGALNINGNGANIAGYPTGRFDAASAVAYVAVDLHGIAATCTRWRWEINANVTNCTLFRASGEFSTVGEVTYAGSGGSFKYGVELSKQDGTAVDTAGYGQQLWQMVDDGVTAHAFSALVRYRSVRSRGGPIKIRCGGRHFFNSIVEVDGQRNSLVEPQIDSSAGSNFGILQKDDAEFFDVEGGELVGNYLANSVGIQSGDGSKLVGAPAVGQLKLNKTKIRNWDIGWRITGTCDTPAIVSGTIANNKTAHIQIDSQRGADIWPISGMLIAGVYSEEVAFPGCPFLHFKSGQFLAGNVDGGEVGYTGTAVLVEAGMNANSCQFNGGRYPAAAAGDAITTPNVNSQFYFGRIAQSGSNLIGKGANASKAMSAFDPTLVGLVIGANLGSISNRINDLFTDIYTANYGTVLANSTKTLTFFFAGVPTATTADLLVTMTAGINKPGIVWDWWIDSANNIGGSATNVTGADIAAVSSGVRFTIKVFG